MLTRIKKKSLYDSVTYLVQVIGQRSVNRTFTSSPRLKHLGISGVLYAKQGNKVAKRSFQCKVACNAAIVLSNLSKLMLIFYTMFYFQSCENSLKCFLVCLQ